MSTFDDFVQDLNDQPLNSATQRAHLNYLSGLPENYEAAAPGSRRPRRLMVVGVSAALVLAVSGGTAAALGLFSKAGDTATAYCYATATLDERHSNRTEYAVQGSGDGLGDAAAAGIDICAIYWRSGVFTSTGAVDPATVPTGGARPVPTLVACVLPSGKAGIFPGNSTTCTSLGLSTLRP